MYKKKVASINYTWFPQCTWWLGHHIYISQWVFIPSLGAHTNYTSLRALLYVHNTTLMTRDSLAKWRYPMKLGFYPLTANEGVHHPLCCCLYLISKRWFLAPKKKTPSLLIRVVWSFLLALRHFYIPSSSLKHIFYKEEESLQQEELSFLVAL